MTYKEKSVGIGEAYSLIVRATTGCSYNKCSFCSKYNGQEFKVRDFEDVLEDLKIARKHYNNINKIFISDGDPLAIDTEKLIRILDAIRDLFPENEELYIYASALSVLGKDIDELNELNRAGLTTVYMGIDSGCDRVLSNINKGVNKEELVLAGRKIKHCNMELYTRVISGLGGTQHSKDHAEGTAAIINRIKPDMISIEDVCLKEGSPMYIQAEEGVIKLLTPRETLTEVMEMVSRIKLDGDTIIEVENILDASVIHGILPKDRETIISNIDRNINQVGYMDGKNKRI